MFGGWEWQNYLLNRQAELWCMTLRRKVRAGGMLGLACMTWRPVVSLTAVVTAMSYV